MLQQTEKSSQNGRLWRGQSSEARQQQQRDRLLRAAAAVVTRDGYPATTAQTISTEAKMSKATFYAHFDNKEECFLALFDFSARYALHEVVKAARTADVATKDRQRGGLGAFLELVEEEPVIARAVLVEGMHGGSRAMAQRDLAVTTFAEAMFRETQDTATQTGGPRFASLIDAVAVAGAAIELISRHLRNGHPATLAEVRDTVERLLDGVLVD